MARQVVGFIGLGLMGAGMARNILAKGNDLLVVAHRDRTTVDALVAGGAREVGSPREMAAEADVIVLCLNGSAVVEAVVRGDDGILAGARAGLLVIDTSSSDPVSTGVLAAELAAAGAALVDAPLSRTPKEAAEGTLDCMVGGADADVARAWPVIACFAAKIVHTGPVGAGHTMKLLNNFVSISYAAIYSEALALGALVGIAPAQFHAVIGGGRMSCGFYDTFMQYVVGRDRDAHRFSIRNAHKDLRYLANLANAAGSANVIAPVVKGYLASAEAMGKGDDYLPMLADHVAALNGITLAEPVPEA